PVRRPRRSCAGGDPSRWPDRSRSTCCSARSVPAGSACRQNRAAPEASQAAAGPIDDRHAAGRYDFADVTHHEEPARRDELPRRFGFWTGLFVVVASMVGSGILTTSGYLLRDTGSHLVVLALWAVGGLVALCGTLTLAELAAAFPRV